MNVKRLSVVILPLSEPWFQSPADEYVEQISEQGCKIAQHDGRLWKWGIVTTYPVLTMNDDATMSELASKYEGMDRFAARKAIVKI